MDNNATQISLTTNELVMLQMIACNCYISANYSEPKSFDECGSPWSNCLDDCELKDGMVMPDSKSFGGIVSSLVKKGLAECSGMNDPEDCTALTEEGFKVWQDQVQKVDFS